MQKLWLSGMLAATILAGCGPKNHGQSASDPIKPNDVHADIHNGTHTGTLTADETDPVIATAGKTTIRQSELQEPLLQAYGLNLLMYIVQRDMAHDAARQAGLVVSPEDIKREREWTLGTMFASAPPTQDREKLLEQFLAQPKPRDQMMTRVEFDIVLETNAAMRKLAEVNLKDAISDEDLQKQFDERYGASVQVRHIMLSNPQEVLQAKRRLDADEKFEDVARVLSRNPETKLNGGLLPPFTINDRRFPENFRKVAFGLKEGEVSSQVQAEGSYHLIKLERRIPPKAVKFEDVKNALRDDLQNQLIIEAVKAIRTKLGQQALATLKVAEPTLKAEFEKRLAAQDKMIHDREQIKAELEKQREQLNATTQPATQPAEPVGPVAPPSTNLAPAAATTAPAAKAPAGASTSPAPTTAPAKQ